MDESNWRPCLMVSVHNTAPEANSQQARVESLLRAEGLKGEAVVDTYNATQLCVFVEAEVEDDILKARTALVGAGVLPPPLTKNLRAS